VFSGIRQDGKMRVMKVLICGICLVVFCLPLYLVRFEIFGIPTTVLEILIYSLFIFWLITKLRITSYGLRITKLFIPVMLIVAGVTLATIFSSDLRTSAGIWKGWFVDPLLFFIMVISIVNNSKQVKKILSSLFLSGVVVAIISLVYLIQGKLDPLGRLQGFYNSPNYLAMYLAPALIIGFCFLIFKNPKYHFCSRQGGDPYNPPIIFNANDSPLKSQKQYFGFFLGVILLSVPFVFAKSYGAWLAIVAALGLSLYYLISEVKHRRFILVLMLIAILVLGYFALIERVSSFKARLTIWQKAWQIFRTSPILGIGPGTFCNYFPPYPEWGVPQPHNIFLAFLLQTGIIGFIGFIWLLIWFYKTPLSGVKKTSIVLITIMTYMLVHGLVDTTYWKNDLSLVFWLIVGLMVILQNKNFRE